MLVGNKTAAAGNAFERWLHFMITNTQTGEFCLYATAMLGPLYYFIFKDYRAKELFPSTRSFMVISGIILLVSGGLFAAQRAETLFGLQSLDTDLIYEISLGAYITALIIVYLAHVYKNFLESGASFIIKTDTQDFVDQYNTRAQ